MNQRLSTLFSTLQGRTRGVLLFLALVVTTALWAEDFSVNGIYYNILTDKINEVAVTYRGSSHNSYYYNEYSGSVTIPETVTYNGTTYSVTSIGNRAFEGCSGLTSVTIPNSVTSIGSSAFYGCSGLTSITIPNSVTSIGSTAFYNCSSLTSPVYNAHCFAYMPTSYSGAYTIPEGIKQIAGYAFEGCSSLTSITIPNSVTSIGNYAFFGCVFVLDNFINNSSLNAEENNYWEATIANKEIDGLLIKNDTVIDCRPAVVYVTIPNSVTSIGDYAFRDCTGLTSITIPNSVTSIGDYAFRGCSSLTSITIPNSVTSIGDYAFLDCTGLTSITIPNSVTSIGSSAFSGCSSLTSVVWNAENCADFSSSYAPFYNIRSQITSFTFGDSVQHIPAYMCYGMNNLTSITIPNSVTSIGSSAFRDCTGLTSITIPNSVTSIGNYAFYNCSSLTSITIPNSVTSIGNYAFYNCSGLTSITIPNSVTSIGNYAFSRCSSLTSVTIGNSVTSIGDYAFSGCSGLISIIVEDTNSTYDSRDNCNAIIKTATNTLRVGCKNTTIPNSVTSIGNYAFYGCSSLTSITIPNSVTSIGSIAFCDCTGLTSITSLAEVPPTLGSSVFYNVSTTIPVYVCAVSAYQSAEGWKAFTNIQELLVEYSIAVGVNDSIMGTAMVDYNTYCEGAQITATANQGYHFVQWSDGNTDNPRALVLTQDTTFTAEFAPNQYQLSLATNYSEMGSVQGAGTYDYLTEIEISATANYGYHFTQWNDGNTDNPRTVQVIGDTTYIAQFDKNIYTITTTWDNQMGSVDAPDSAEYLDQVTITASAKVGYHFTQWSDGITDNPRTIVLNKDIRLTANFAQAYSGQCGDNLYWAYDEANKTISITGSGDMYDYTPSTQSWYLFQEQITEVTTSNTTSSIGTSAFEGCIRLSKVSLGYGMENIAAKAFAECKRLYDIYCYASYPPFAEQSSFANYNVYVYIPCEYQRDYTLDVVWGEFKFIECIGAESDETGGDDIVITPGSTDVTITWPTENNADTYTIVIKKVGEVVCTLTFNADGQLLNIAFAPGREGNHPAQYAEQANNGYRFTVTGLDESTKYGYNLDVKDSTSQTIKSYSGEFTTNSTTAIENTHSQSPMTNCQKLIRNGQLIIIRDGVEYDALGQEL